MTPFLFLLAPERREMGYESLREALRGMSDVERITARIALRQVRPRGVGRPA